MEGFSIIIPTLNRTNFLLDTLNDLIVQDFDKDFEILIIDQSIKEDQAVIEFSRGHDNVNYHFITSFRGLPEARNFGASKAKFSYILYVDDDIRCKDNFLQEHYHTLIADESIGIVAGGITEKHKHNLDVNQIGGFSYWTATPYRGFHKRIQAEVEHAGGGNFSIKREVLKKIQGVDEHLTRGAALYEETDLCLRAKKAGYKVWFNYDAHVEHLAADTGGCRVEDINKYIYSLARNRSIIIVRHLPTIYKITADIYLFRLIASYAFSYRKISIFSSYWMGRKEGRAVNSVKVTTYE